MLARIISRAPCVAAAGAVGVRVAISADGARHFVSFEDDLFTCEIAPPRLTSSVLRTTYSVSHGSRVQHSAPLAWTAQRSPRNMLLYMDATTYAAVTTRRAPCVTIRPCRMGCKQARIIGIHAGTRYHPEPVLGGLAPQYGPIDGGDTLTLSGGPFLLSGTSGKVRGPVPSAT